MFYEKWKKYNKIQLTKNKMDLNIRKMTNHPPSPTPLIQTCHSCRDYYKLLLLFKKVGNARLGESD